MSLQKIVDVNQTLETRAVKNIEIVLGAAEGAQARVAALTAQLPVVGGLLSSVAPDGGHPPRRHELVVLAVRAPYALQGRLLSGLQDRQRDSNEVPARPVAV